MNPIKLKTDDFYNPNDSIKFSIKKLASANGFEHRDYGGVAGFTAILKLFVLKKNYGKISGQLPSGNKFALYFLDVSSSLIMDMKIRSLRVMQIDVPFYTPQIIINASDSIALPIEFSRQNKYELEGDIPEFFNIYVARGHEIEALMALAPNIITSMLEYGQVCDIEIYGGSIYFYWSGYGKEERDMEHSFELAQQITQILQPALKSADIRNTNDANAAEIKLKLAQSQLPAIIRSALFILSLLFVIGVGFNPLGIILGLIIATLGGFYLIRDWYYLFKAHTRKAYISQAINKYKSR